VTSPGPASPPFDAVAVVDEQVCIGCTLCIQACPVDAIVGAAGVMHTVIAQECTSCRLCIAPCPVDCISMRSTGELTPEQKRAAEALAQRRTAARQRRLQREDGERALQRAAAREAAAEKTKRETIQKAMARAKVRLQQRER
jgi:electron transport complex protein RnfB